MADTTTMANAIRALAMDAVQQANCGHPGAPMGMAEMAVALWHQHLRHNPANPHWADRDRFVLSNGHASMLLYAVLHLSGYDLSMDDIRHFRQWHSKTPGHPEVGCTPGVETTTGPLGQGIANAVGLALAEKLLAAEFNRGLHRIVDHYTYAFLGDGCLMEGITQEACSLAGVWHLNRLIALYDDNGISIDGQVGPWFADDTPARFRAMGWNVIDGVNGHNVPAISAAIEQARGSLSQPTLIVCKTTIGHGSPLRAGTAKAHGEPLGAEEITRTRAAIDWPFEAFDIPGRIRQAWNARERGQAAEAEWQQRFAAYRDEYPELAAQYLRRVSGALPDNFAQVFESALGEAERRSETVASRKASQIALETLTAALPELLGGSADLTGSNLTHTTSTPPLRFEPATGAVIRDEQGRVGRHINYGVREFGMAAIMNGVALHGGYIPYGGTFMTFSDYSRNAIRMAALMKQRVVHVLTHDSIGLGEDGPTHQPIEHAASLRLIPGLDVWRPADTTETTAAWCAALTQASRPSALLLSRQNLPHLHKRNPHDILRGGYVLAEPQDAGLKKKAQAVILATGSEVQLAVRAQALLAESGIAVRVVSVPSTTVFDRQPQDYKAAVLPPGLPRIAVEAGVTDFWWKYGCDAVIGIDHFGESAPAAVLFSAFGFTPENVAQTVRAVLQKGRRGK